MTVSKEDIEKLRAQGLTHFATLLESHSATSIDESASGSSDIGAGSGDVAAEGIGSLFEGQDAEVVKKATALFESAVEKKVESRMALVEAQVAGQMQSYAAQQDKTVNDYLDTVVTEWLKENEMKIYESSVVEQAKAMVAQVKTLFEGMGLAFDDQILAKKLAVAEAAVAESNALIEAQETALIKHEITAIVTEAKVGLSDVQAAALDVIVGESEFEGIDKLKEIIPTMIEAAKKDDVEPTSDKDAKTSDEPAGDDEEAEAAAKKKADDEEAEKKVAEAAALELASKKDPLIEATLAQLRRGSKSAKK